MRFASELHTIAVHEVMNSPLDFHLVQETSVPIDEIDINESIHWIWDSCFASKDKQKHKDNILAHVNKLKWVFELTVFPTSALKARPPDCEWIMNS